MKKLLTVLLTFLMISICTGATLAEETAEIPEPEIYTSGDYLYIILENGTAEIKKYLGATKELTIPDELDGKRLTSIADEAFNRCSALTSVTIPDSVINIGNNPFANCYYLTDIIVSIEQPYLATIDGVLFSKPDRRLVCYPSAFTADSYSIPRGIQIIGDLAFDMCDSLTSLTIPDSVTSIGDRAFSGCTSLTSIAIPDGVTRIGDWAFNYCLSLTNIQMPDSLASIGIGAFSRCHSMISVTIPSSVTTVGDLAFEECSSLTSVIIPGSVSAIGNGTFYGCQSLTSVSLPDSITRIGDHAFSGCTSLTGITIPHGVTRIEEGAFASCTSLKTITIPDSVTSLGNGVFHSCTALSNITIPDSVTSIGDTLFFGCRSLTSIEIPDSVTSIGKSAFSGCRSLSFIAIPDGVKSIGNESFSYCQSLSSVTMPDSITSIGRKAFYECQALTDITIPTGVTNIGDMAFSINLMKQNVPIPSLTVTVFHDSYAAQYCKDNGIKYIYPDSMDWLMSGIPSAPENTSNLDVESTSQPASLEGTWELTEIRPLDEIAEQDRTMLESNQMAITYTFEANKISASGHFAGMEYSLSGTFIIEDNNIIVTEDGKSEPNDPIKFKLNDNTLELTYTGMTDILTRVEETAPMLIP